LSATDCVYAASLAKGLGESPPGRDVWVGYHRDLRRLARLRALLDLTIARLATKRGKPRRPA